MIKLTHAEIEAGKTPKGGYNKAQLAAWGITWPPPPGWKQALLNGAALPALPESANHPSSALSPIDPTSSAHELLAKVVGAIIAAGHASDLWNYPDVLAYFGARLPDESECDPF